MADPLTLSMAAFLALAGQCGDGIAPATLANLQAHESGFRIIAININGKGGGTVKHIKTKAQAIALSKTLYARGVSFDAGIAQINSKNFKWLGVTPESVFDPCEAIKAQARLLKSYSKYNTGDEKSGFKNGYVDKVIAAQSKVRAEINAQLEKENGSRVQRKPEGTMLADSGVDGGRDLDGSYSDNFSLNYNQNKIRKLIVKEYP